MATVQLDSIRKIYPNGYEAVKRLDLSIESGEFIASWVCPVAGKPRR